MKEQSVFVGIGSNLQNPIDQVIKALNALTVLPESKLIAHSSLYQSDSLLAGQPPYINSVAELETNLSATELLSHLQDIELQQGRERHERWGARTLDLDIILFKNLQLDTPKLIIPHAQMYARSFVLVPLLEIAPDLALPDGNTLKTLLLHCPSQNLQRINKTFCINQKD